MNRFVVLVLVSVASACSTTHTFARSELKKLDGFRAGNDDGHASVLSCRNGEQVEFKGSLSLHLRDADEPFAGRFEYIRVDDEALAGRLDSGESVRFKWSSVESAEMVTRDATRTALLTTGIVLGGTLTAVLLYFAVSSLARGLGDFPLQ
jgi:hypothetical protein